ncbi:MAG: AraC family transcriptional regulator [Nevskiaceae bacterium]|nr:MAG: AraC family transcriptional regulator [Nevskiaceae bacterium]TAM24396.1 MAG: AraC family transcriptional regulator [Nevskiaceae bacterium]
MPLYEPYVPTRYTAPLLDYLREGQPAWLDAALGEAGVEASLLSDPEAQLGFAQFDRLLSALGRLSGRRDLGFELGLRITRDTHGPLGQALGRCANVDELLQLASRYSRLMSPSFSLLYRPRAQDAELLWRPAAGMSADTLRAFYEVHVVSLYRLLHDLLGSRLPAYECWLPMARPAHADRYRELRQLRLHFVESPLPEVRTLLKRELLALPLALTGDEGIGGAELAQLQSGVSKARRWSDWVRLMLREADAHQPTQAELAALLNMSAHSLARRLSTERCSYRQLAAEVRHQRACALLREGRLGIAQIAHRLGYGELSNFSHAFRKQQGLGPKAYRQSLRASAGGVADEVPT